MGNIFFNVVAQKSTNSGSAPGSKRSSYVTAGEDLHCVYTRSQMKCNKYSWSLCVASPVLETLTWQPCDARDQLPDYIPATPTTPIDVFQ